MDVADPLRHPGADTVEALDGTRHHVGPGTTGTPDQHAQRVRWQQVVGVDERQELAPRSTHAGVAGRAEPAVGTGEELDARVAADVVQGDRARAVRRPVVDEQDLEVLERLGEDGVEALPEVGLDVVEGDDHADGWA